MIAPTQRAVLAAVALVPLALAPAFVWRPLWTVWVVGEGLLVVACLVDALFGLPRRWLSIETSAPKLLHIGERAQLVVRLGAPRERSRAVTGLRVLCDLGPTLTRQPAQEVALAKGAGEVRIDLSPVRRGRAAIEALWLQWAGPLGLMVRTARVALDQTLAVVPNTRLVRSAALRFATRDAQIGSKVERYPGEGSEFDALREHSPGMDLRALHWKASARHRKLLSREFRAERDHQVMLCLDAGRMMVESVDGLSRLDHAIHAALLLTYFSLRGGDRVGLYSYDVQPRTYARPEGGAGAFARLLRATAEVDGRLEEPNHIRAFVDLARHLRRRSLVVIFTEFVDSIAAALLVEGLERLARRHVVLFVTLGAEDLVATRAAAPREIGQLYRTVVAAELLRDRQVVLQRLRRAGVQCVDAPPGLLSGRLLNRYLEIRRRGLV